MEPEKEASGSYSFSSVRSICEEAINDIQKLASGRSQKNITIVTDERSNIDDNLGRFHENVFILKINGLRLESVFTTIKTHPKFGNGTIWVFSGGTHDVLLSEWLQDCLDFKCPNPPIILTLPTFATKSSHLVDVAVQLNLDILQSTENDIAVFCGLIPVCVNRFNRYVKSHRQCTNLHNTSQIAVDPIMYSHYTYIVKLYNDFTKYHAQELGYSPWDLEVPEFGKKISIQRQLLSNGYHINPDEDIKQARKAELLCEELLNTHQKQIREESPAIEMHTLLVDRLSCATTAQSFKSYFEQFGEVVRSVVMKNRKNISKGFGFVAFSSSSTADEALHQLQHVVDKIIVDVIRIDSNLFKLPESGLEECREGVQGDVLQNPAGQLRKLYVSGLDQGVSEVSFKDYFSQFGEVEGVKINKDKSGHGLVLFTLDSAVDESLMQISHKINGSNIVAEKGKLKARICNEGLADTQRMEESKERLESVYSQRASSFMDQTLDSYVMEYVENDNYFMYKEDIAKQFDATLSASTSLPAKTYADCFIEDSNRMSNYSCENLKFKQSMKMNSNDHASFSEESHLQELSDSSRSLSGYAVVKDIFEEYCDGDSVELTRTTLKLDSKHILLKEHGSEIGGPNVYADSSMIDCNLVLNDLGLNLQSNEITNMNSIDTASFSEDYLSEGNADSSSPIGNYAVGNDILQESCGVDSVELTRTTSKLETQLSFLKENSSKIGSLNVYADSSMEDCNLILNDSCVNLQSNENANMNSNDLASFAEESLSQLNSDSSMPIGDYTVAKDILQESYDEDSEVLTKPKSKSESPHSLLKENCSEIGCPSMHADSSMEDSNIILYGSGLNLRSNGSTNLNSNNDHVSFAEESRSQECADSCRPLSDYTVGKDILQESCDEDLVGLTRPTSKLESLQGLLKENCSEIGCHNMYPDSSMEDCKILNDSEVLSRPRSKSKSPRAQSLLKENCSETGFPTMYADSSMEDCYIIDSCINLPSNKILNMNSDDRVSFAESNEARPSLIGDSQVGNKIMQESCDVDSEEVSSTTKQSVNQENILKENCTEIACSTFGISNEYINNKIFENSTKTDESSEVSVTLPYLDDVEMASEPTLHSPSFNKVFVVGKKELIKDEFSGVDQSKLIYHCLNDFKENNVQDLLLKAKSLPENSVCCLVFDISIIGTKLVVSTKSNKLQFIKVLNVKRLNSYQNLLEFNHFFSCLVETINNCASKISEFLPVIILPLVPKRIYCDEYSQSDKLFQKQKDFGPYVLSGSCEMCREVIKSAVISWNILIEAFNIKYHQLNCISNYLSTNPITYPILEWVSDLNLEWTEHRSWKTMAENVLSYLVPFNIEANSLESSTNHICDSSLSTTINLPLSESFLKSSEEFTSTNEDSVEIIGGNCALANVPLLESTEIRTEELSTNEIEIGEETSVKVYPKMATGNGLLRISDNSSENHSLVNFSKQNCSLRFNRDDETKWDLEEGEIAPCITLHSPPFSNIFVVGKKSLIDKSLYGDCQDKSKLICYNLNDFEDIQIQDMLQTVKSLPKNSVCCLVFDITIIGTETLKIKSRYSIINCNALNATLNSDQNLIDFKEQFLNLIQIIKRITAKLSEFLPVIILPLIPKRIYCNENPQTNTAIETLKLFEPYVLMGTISLCREATQYILAAWSTLVKAQNKDLIYLDCISSYMDTEPETYAVMDYAGYNELDPRLSEYFSWKDLAQEVVHSSLATRCCISSKILAKSASPNLTMKKILKCSTNKTGDSVINIGESQSMSLSESLDFSWKQMPTSFGKRNKSPSSSLSSKCNLDESSISFTSREAFLSRYSDHYTPPDSTYIMHCKTTKSRSVKHFELNDEHTHGKGDYQSSSAKRYQSNSTKSYRSSPTKSYQSSPTKSYQSNAANSYLSSSANSYQSSLEQMDSRSRSTVMVLTKYKTSKSTNLQRISISTAKSDRHSRHSRSKTKDSSRSSHKKPRGHSKSKSKSLTYNSNSKHKRPLEPSKICSPSRSRSRTSTTNSISCSETKSFAKTNRPKPKRLCRASESINKTRSKSRSSSSNSSFSSIRSRSQSVDKINVPKLKIKYKRSLPIGKAENKYRSSLKRSCSRSRSRSSLKRSCSRSRSRSKSSSQKDKSIRKSKNKSRSKQMMSPDLRRSKSKSLTPKSRTNRKDECQIKVASNEYKTKSKSRDSRLLTSCSRSRSRSNSWSRFRKCRRSRSKSLIQIRSECVMERLPSDNYAYEKVLSEPSDLYKLPTDVQPINTQQNFGKTLKENLDELGKQIELKFMEEYCEQLDKVCLDFEEKYKCYREIPEFYPDFEKYYSGFSDMYRKQYVTTDESYMNSLWKQFWESKFDSIKVEDWKIRQRSLLQEYETKIAKEIHSQTVHVFKKYMTATVPFDYAEALSLLEFLCDKLAFVGIALKSIIIRSKGYGATTMEGYRVFTEHDNITLLNTSLIKFENLYHSDTEDYRSLYEKVIDWIPKLLEEAKTRSSLPEALANIFNLCRTRR